MNKIGLKFKLKRESCGLTQSDFSKALGITQGYLSDLENGVKIPSDTLLLLFEHIIKSQEEEMYKAKYIMLAEKHMVALQRVLSLKEQISSLEQVPELSRNTAKSSKYSNYK